LRLCVARGARESGEIQASSLATLVQMVAMGLGITLLPSMAVVQEVRRARGLVCVPFVRPRPGRTISLAWRPTSPRSREFRLLTGLLAPGAR